ncbi:MAG: hypothetical protein HYY67_09115, partial [Thaumarchaeota archaeon]|nr:hypothetical protein [Nitrososphaerota archaeon]
TGHKIGRVDAKTGEITEYPTPTKESGTRRIAIDSRGMLWFTEYNVGKIGSFDPKTNQMKEYPTGSESSGPYAIWVDIHDNVWFSMTRSFKVGKFDQITQTLQEYDLPTPRTIIRFIYADHEGKIWFPNNNNNKIGVITPNTKAEEQKAPQVENENKVPADMAIGIEKPESPKETPQEQKVGPEGQIIGLPIMGMAATIGAIVAILAYLRYRKKPAS